MPLCSVVSWALGTHGVRVAAQHPGAPGSGGLEVGKQTGGAGCVYLWAFIYWQHIDGRVFLLLTDGHCLGDEDQAGSSPEGLQLHPRVQDFPGPCRGGRRLKPGGHGGDAVPEGPRPPPCLVLSAGTSAAGTWFQCLRGQAQVWTGPCKETVAFTFGRFDGWSSASDAEAPRPSRTLTVTTVALMRGRNRLKKPMGCIFILVPRRPRSHFSFCKDETL